VKDSSADVSQATEDQTNSMEEPSPSVQTDSTIDVDLTTLSSTMVYAEVYNMMTVPNEYMGKTIKMGGQYYANYYEETGLYYHCVIIADATACCQQGLEFKWNGDHTYPDDYPADNSEIEVVGVFGSYDELGQTYYYLAVDNITIK
jgi:hypothetical protein